MKNVFLTKTGVLATQKGGKWAYFSNDGKFRREATNDEAMAVSKVAVLATVGDNNPFSIPEMPVWKKLWTVTDRDDSQMIGSLANNGGAYGYRTERTYYCANINGKAVVRVKTRMYSTAEFSQDDNGVYCGSHECTTYDLVNVEGGEYVTLQGVYYDEYENPIRTQSAVLEEYTDEVSWEIACKDAETYISSPYSWGGERQYEEPETFTEEVTVEEYERRINIITEIGYFDINLRRCVTRNKRR